MTGLTVGDGLGQAMHRTGHCGAALLAYAPIGLVVTAVGHRDLALVGGVIAVALSTLPDADEYIPLIAHRGPTHTVWFALAIGGLGAAVGGAVAPSVGGLEPGPLAAFGFVVGAVTIGSHLVADVLTPMGVRPFAPVRKRHYTLDVTPSRNPTANVAFLVLGAVATVVSLALGTAMAPLS